MELNLRGKTALITGGARGIGLAIKKALEEEGVKVISWSRSEGQDLMKEIPDIPNVDILINNIGGMGRVTYANSEDCMYKNYQIMNNLTHQFFIQKKYWGRVITISSMFGKEKGRNQYFTAAKAAQIAYMKALSGTVFDTTFNTVCPGYVDVGKPVPSSEFTDIKPEDIANIVTFLCSDRAKHIDGTTITVDGGTSHSF